MIANFVPLFHHLRCIVTVYRISVACMLYYIYIGLAVTVYRSLHGTAPQYLSDRLQYVADLPTRRRGRLRSSTSSLLDVRPSRRVTVGDRSFAAAGLGLWNSLPADVQSAPSLASFRQKLKTHLFRQSHRYCSVAASPYSGPSSYLYT